MLYMHYLRETHKVNALVVGWSLSIYASCYTSQSTWRVSI